MFLEHGVPVVANSPPWNAVFNTTDVYGNHTQIPDFCLLAVSSYDGFENGFRRAGFFAWLS
jgi:hypothetical protein